MMEYFEVKSRLHDVIKCEICPYFTTSVFRMECHSLRHQLSLKRTPFNCENANVEVYRCRHCNFQTALILLFKKHLDLCHNPIFPIVTYAVRKYTCEKCDFETHFSLDWMQHTLKYHEQEKTCNVSCGSSGVVNDNFMYNYDECDFKTKHRSNLKIRFNSPRLDPSKKNIYTCKNCGFETHDSLDWMQHTVVCHDQEKNCKMIHDPIGVVDDNSKWYNCDQCIFKTKRKGNLESHLLKHLKIPQDITIHKCAKCPFTNPSKHKLKMHLNARHLDENHATWYNCEECPYKTKNIYNLRGHIRNNHRGQKWHECDQCPYKTNHKSTLNRHIKSRHSHDTNKYSCKNCEFKTHDSLDWMQHIVVCNEQQKNAWFHCDQCNFKTEHKDSLEAHVLEHLKVHQDVAKYKCVKCPYKTSSKGSMKMHLNALHLDEKDVTWYNCKECSYKAKHRRTLQSHVKYHHMDIKWYECEKCPYKSKQITKVKKHFKLRHLDAKDIKWYECEKCSYKGKEEAYLRKHISLHHADKQD
ncbi:hypothetical protein Zmor_013018 [Zophobas morio]|uniref:Protein hunchback n=1 Tax=Zophobas morio TaxID=2755281 RepID=A0AA38MF73_9CUCU|nr:hypothetical protein Zmor_013018 [Zophobas morio]